MSPIKVLDASPAAGAPPRTTLDARQWALFAAGIAVAVTVLPPISLALFVLNGLFGFWLARQPWDWKRRYGFFFLIESVYFFLKIRFPRPGPGANPVFHSVLPAGEYFAFLWFSVEVILYLKLLDYVLSAAKESIGERSPASFWFFLFYPFGFLAGPPIGFDQFNRAYHRGPLTRDDLIYCARKCMWGAAELFLLAVWLRRAALDLRAAVVTHAAVTQYVDSRLLMWLWLGSMSVLLYLAHKGFIDLMAGFSRLAGYEFPEQFWFSLWSKDPVEYWRNSNRAVYMITTQHIFHPFFLRKKIAAKSMMATMASGAFHAMICPSITLAGGALLGALVGLSGIGVVLTNRLRTVAQSPFLRWMDEGPGHNAIVITGTILTFALMAFPRSGFLLMLEGLTVRQWFHLIQLLFVRV